MDHDDLVKWASDPATIEAGRNHEEGYRRGFTHALSMFCNILNKAKNITEAKELARRSTNIAYYFSSGPRRGEDVDMTSIIERFLISGYEDLVQED
jgi:hypothetical protein